MVIKVIRRSASIPTGDAQPNGTECVTSYGGQTNGDYQSRTSCHMYVTCSNGKTHKDRPCPGNLVWDDYNKLWDLKNATCPSTAQPQSKRHVQR